MCTNLSLEGWLDHLRVLEPVLGVVHVGVGNGRAADRYADWGVDFAILVEANEDLRDKLAATLRGRDNWTVHSKLVSSSAVDMDFFVASNSNESGVLRPEAFAALWRNLNTRERRRLNATTLEAILAVSNGGQKVNWAVVDCVPALPILLGASHCLDRWDVIVARVILDESKAPDEDASKSRIDEFLSSRGYWCVACQQELQPAIGSALYIRNWKLLFQSKLENEIRLASAHQQQLEQFINAQETQTRLASEREQKVAQLAARVDELQRQLERVTQESAERKNCEKVLENQLREVTQARDALIPVAEERLAQLGRQAKAHEEQTLAFETIRGQLASQVNDLQRRLENFTRESDERQRIVNLLEKRLHEMAEAHHTISHVSEERRAQLGQQAKALEEQALAFEAVKERLAAQIPELQRQLDAVTRESDEQASLAKERLAQIEKGDASETRLRHELREAKQSASLAIRLQTLREADLEDLQVRYQASVSIQDRQHQMLVKLGEQLSAASRYFQQFVVKRDALVPDLEDNSKIQSELHAKHSPMRKYKNKSRPKSNLHPKLVTKPAQISTHRRSTSKLSSKPKK
jgi:hypothetical protein